MATSLICNGLEGTNINMDDAGKCRSMPVVRGRDTDQLFRASKAKECQDYFLRPGETYL